MKTNFMAIGRILPVTTALLGLGLFTCSHLEAQEKLGRAEAMKIAFIIGSDLKTINGTPIPTDVDLKHPVAMKDEEFGALVLPEAKLSGESFSKAGSGLVPVGQLWLHKLTLVRNGDKITRDQLRMVDLMVKDENVSAPQCTLAARKDGAGKLELVVLGKSKEPLLSVPLKQIEKKQESPIEIKAERESESGKLTLQILGQYEAVLTVGEL